MIQAVKPRRSIRKITIEMLAPQSAPEHVAASMTPNVATGAIAASIPGPGPNTQPRIPASNRKPSDAGAPADPVWRMLKIRSPSARKAQTSGRMNLRGPDATAEDYGSLVVVPAADDPEAIRRASSYVTSTRRGFEPS